MLGGPLFERSKRRIILTPLGEAIVARARQILAETAGRGLSARRSPDARPYLLPRLMRTLCRPFKKPRPKAAPRRCGASRIHAL
ncbi:hypothetical protein AB4Z01_20470 [Inquilinus sp. YAF38]